MRSVGAFVLGWLAMLAVVIAGFTVGPRVLGIDRVFEPGSYEATTLWVAVTMVIGLVAGMAGGWVGLRVGRSRRTVVTLGVFVLASALFSELSRSSEPPRGTPPPRPSDLEPAEALASALEHGSEPPVTRVTNPLVGLVGLALGAALAARGRRRREA